MPAARWGRLLLALPDPWVSDTDVRGARTVRCADRGRIADGRHDTLTGMNTMMQFDDSVSRKVEAVYSTADIVEHRHAIQNLLDLQPGEDVLDIGSGPGFLAVEMAVRVGASGSVHGIEPSEQMRGVAARRRLGDPAAPVTFGGGDAVALPFADASFDVATATQVYEYVADMPAALAEAHRVLRPRGRLLILDTDWDSIVWHSSDPARMQRVLAAWDDHLADPHLPRRLGRLLVGAGFTVTHVGVLPLLNTDYCEDVYSHGLIDFVTGFVPGRGGVTDDDVRAWADDLRGLGPDYFFSLNRYVFLATR
jgi:ubiquinone/menaquinone biosynthesis C-methylase UbiE